jgi:hypothetical protein
LSTAKWVRKASIFGSGGQQILAGRDVVKVDLVNNPLDIGPFGVDGIVVKTENMSDSM